MNRVVPEYFPSLNWAKMRYGLKKGWRMLDEASIDRLKHCLNNSHERIKIFTKSVSKRGYLYTTRNSLLPHQEFFENTEEYRGLIDNLPVEEVDGTLNEFINKKYTEVMTEINLDISPLEERRLNYSPSAQSTFTIFRNSEHIILVKREAGGVAADREILGSIVGFILGISPELYYFGKLNYDSQEYMYLIFRAYNSSPGRFRGRTPGADHGMQSDHEEGWRNLVKDNSTGKWYFIDMGQFDFDENLYMIYE